MLVLENLSYPSRTNWRSWVTPNLQAPASQAGTGPTVMPAVRGRSSAAGGWDRGKGLFWLFWLTPQLTLARRMGGFACSGRYPLGGDGGGFSPGGWALNSAGVPTLDFPRRWPHPLHGREEEAGRSRSVSERLGVNVMPGAWIIIEPETGPAANERQHNTACSNARRHYNSLIGGILSGTQYGGNCRISLRNPVDHDSRRPGMFGLQGTPCHGGA